MLECRGPRVTTQTRIPHPGAAPPPPRPAAQSGRRPALPALLAALLPAARPRRVQLSGSVSGGSSPRTARAGAQRGSSQLAPGSTILSRQDRRATPGDGGGGRCVVWGGQKEGGHRWAPGTTLTAPWGVWMIKPDGRITAGFTNGPKKSVPQARSFWEDKRPLCRKLNLYLTPSPAGGIFATIQIDTLMPERLGCLLSNRGVGRGREDRWLLELPSPPRTSLYAEVRAS